MQLERLRRVFWETYENPYSDFYRTYYAASGFRPSPDFPRSASDWSLLPLLSKEALAATPLERRTFVPQRDVLFYRLSSGTSNRGAVIIPRNFVPDRRFWLAYSQRYMEFLRPGHVPDVSARRAGLNMISGDSSDLPASARLAKLFNIDAISAPPAILQAFVPYLEAEMPLDSIRYLYLWGERVSDAKQRYFAHKFPNALRAVEYGLSEMHGTGGKPCDEQVKAGSLLVHPETEFVQWELIGDEGAPSDEGEIVLSTLWSGSASPLLRYKTGDLARRVAGICHPELESYEIIGRAGYDRVTIPGGILISAELERAMAAFKESLHDDFELHVYPAPDNVRLELRVRPRSQASGENDLQAIARQLSETMRISPERTLREAMTANFVTALKCVLLPEETEVPKKQLRIIVHE
jgi:phenylacetate-coenzyme A ligase PaaK-like adenylate-forming protein